jgi:glucose-1-phosphate thymidylyltransferase
MIGIIPAAGMGERIQPLGCSKELLPVGSRTVDGMERPKAVCEYLVERMIAAGVEQICVVIAPDKTDVIKYFSEREYSAQIFYVVQEEPLGLCDAVFRAEPFACVHDRVLVGLPDTVWFPENGYRAALESLVKNKADVDLLLFPVLNPQVFDSVLCDDNGYVQRIDVKDEYSENHWVWGAFATTGEALHAMKHLWEARHKEDVYLGHLLNAFAAAGNVVRGTYAGEVYLDVGTMEGYQHAQEFIRARAKGTESVAQNPETLEAA